MKKIRTLLVLLGALVLVAAPSLAEAGSRHRGHGHHGYKQHGYKQHGYKHHGYKHGGYKHGGYKYRYYGHGHRYHHGARFSFWLGPLWWGPSYPAYAYPYPYPYPHRETTVIVQEQPVYVERPASDVPAESWWYYCQSAGTYYPEVGSCPEGWQKVAPRPE